MQNKDNSYRVVVIPDLNQGRPITRRAAAHNATEAAGAVLSLLPIGCVDCIEVSLVIPGHHSKGKVTFYSCLYGAGQGFQYADRVVVPS